jgi:hypothetical protein
LGKIKCCLWIHFYNASFIVSYEKLLPYIETRQYLD